MESPQIFASSDDSVKKFVFTFPDAIAEAVLYRYQSYLERTVCCVSVQSGCPVGCTFCGTGKRFLRNLTAEEIVEQAKRLIFHTHELPCSMKRLQIMFMSMGEPFLNYKEVKKAIKVLNTHYPNAQLLVSTVAPNKFRKKFGSFIDLSCRISQIGLQFSIHESTDEARNILIPYEKKLSLAAIRELGECWKLSTKRYSFINYCVHEKNSTLDDFRRLQKLFPPDYFNFTFSVICEKDESLKEASSRNLETIKRFQQLFIEEGYNTRVFNPAGQDDIGGGCGQLWFVQKKIREMESGDK